MLIHLPFKRCKSIFEIFRKSGIFVHLRKSKCLIVESVVNRFATKFLKTSGKINGPRPQVVQAMYPFQFLVICEKQILFRGKTCNDSI